MGAFGDYAFCVVPFLRAFGIETSKLPCRVRVRGVQHPVWVRYGTSDEGIMWQIFHDGQYDAVSSLRDVRLILDFGANIGLSSIRFLNAYPSARVVALEPDVGNFEVLARNLAPYGTRAMCLFGAAWSRRTVLWVPSAHAIGEESAVRVSEIPQVGFVQVPAYDVASLLGLVGGNFIDILKVDIEGAERELFASGASRDWLDQVRNIAIELHGEDCRTAFDSALRGYTFECQLRGEITACLNVQRTVLMI